MRIIVISDTHSDLSGMEMIIDRYKDRADYFIHLGDYDSDVISMKRVYPSLNIIGVRGNGDYFSKAPETIYRDFCGINFMLTHGHRFLVQYTLDNILSVAKEHDCRYVLFGHTHKSVVTSIDGVTLINPGSISAPRDRSYSFAVIDINDRTLEVKTSIVEL